MIPKDVPGGYAGLPGLPTVEPVRRPWIAIAVFVAVWLVLLVALGTLQVAAAGLAAWGAGDGGYHDEPLYQLGLYGSFLLFGATQLGALVGGLMLLWRRQALLWLVPLLGGLYCLWFVGTICALSLR